MEIPGDVMETARECVRNFDSDYVENWSDIIARAILAERQRCAYAARRYLEDIAGCEMSDEEPDKIAAAVMDPKWEPPPL